MKNIKSYKTFEVTKKEILGDCLMDIFDKYKVSEHKNKNVESSKIIWFEYSDGIIIINLPNRKMTEDILEEILKISNTIEARVGEKVTIRRGYDSSMYRDGWIEINLKSDT